MGKGKDKARRKARRQHRRPPPRDAGCIECGSDNDCKSCRLCSDCLSNPLPPGQIRDCGVVAFYHDFRVTGPVSWDAMTFELDRG